MLRTLALTLSLSCAAAASACGGSGDSRDGDRPSTTTQDAAASPTAVPTLAEVGSGGATPAPSVTIAIVADLAARLSTPPASITVVSFAPMTWPNACLGLAARGQVCAQVLTPGWLAILRGPDGQEYRYRGAGGRFLPEP